VSPIKNQWKKIFISLLVITLTIFIVTPLLLRVNFIMGIIYWWLSPIIRYIDGYMILLGTIIGSALTISGAMWQSERNINLERNQYELKNIKHILAEVNGNNNVIELIYKYFEQNKIRKIYFYPDDFTEFWELEDGSVRKDVDCKNNRGILNLKPENSKQFLISEIPLYKDLSDLEDLYNRFDIIILANGYDAKFVEETYSRFFKVQNQLNEHLAKLNW